MIGSDPSRDVSFYLIDRKKERPFEREEMHKFRSWPDHKVWGSRRLDSIVKPLNDGTVKMATCQNGHRLYGNDGSRDFGPNTRRRMNFHSNAV